MRGPRSPRKLAEPGLRASRTVEVELITRLFGGGAEARVVDPGAWLRPSAVRGSIRFWWRALHAHEHESIVSLRAAEDALFGSAATSDRPGAGRVSIVVETTRAVELEGEYAPNQGDAMNVAYFAAAPMGQAAARLGKAKATASLTVSAVDKRDLEAARQPLVCWLLFGGAGARTRRGAGAVAPRPHSATSLGYPESLQELRDFLRSLPVERRAPHVPIFSVADRAGVWTGREENDPDTAHRVLLTMWRDVRQWRPHPEKWSGGTGWGMSEWPEPDLLRHHYRQHSGHHGPRAGKTQALRPHLGLPLGIKFKDRADPQPRFELIPSAGDRYGSPVWLGVSRIGRKFVPLALVTRSRLEGPVRMAGNNRVEFPLGPAEQAYSRLVDQLNVHGFEKVTT